ncbi:MAG TPA: prolyl oligopeptidase family serine peptidase, partial [bacterium]
NMNLALTSIQSGGAYTIIDDFNIYRWRNKSGLEPKALVRPNNEKLVDSKFSKSGKNELQEFLKEFASIKQEIGRLSLQQAPASEINDLANLEVELLAIQKSLNDCDSPDNFHFYQESIKKGIAQAKSNLASLKEKQNPFHHKIGTFMRGYYSEIDGSLQGYALYAPDKYDGKTSFPLVINLHGYDPSFSSWQENLFLPVFMPHATTQGRYILVNPFGRGNTMYQNIGEHDVLTVLSEVKRLYHIDENRIYLTGGSMGGAGTWNIGLSYPDQFAAIAPIMGPTEFAFWNNPSVENLSPVRKFILEQRSALSIAENALNLPMFCNHGILDDIVPIEQSRKMVKRFSDLGYEITYVEHPEAAHGGFKPEMDYEIHDWFENFQRNPYPKRIIYKTGNLKHPGAYWVRINRFIDLLKFATIEAEITSPNLIEVKTDNVAEFSLTFSDELVNIKLPVKISVNGRLCFQGELSDDKKITSLARSSKQGKIIDWSESDLKKNSSFAKNSVLAGPIIDAYNSSFMLIYGTIGTGQETSVNKQEAETFVDQWRSWQHMWCRIKSDTDVTADDIANFNLILFGNTDCNAMTKKVNASLPIRF